MKSLCQRSRWLSAGRIWGWAAWAWGKHHLVAALPLLLSLAPAPLAQLLLHFRDVIDFTTNWFQCVHFLKSLVHSTVQIFNLGALIYLFSPFIPVGKLLFKVDSDGIIKVKWLERNRQLSAAGSKDLNKNHKENCFYFLYCCLPHSMQNVILKNYVGDLPYYFYKSHFKTCFKSIISCHLVSCGGIRKKELSKQFFPLCWTPKQKLRFPTLI